MFLNISNEVFMREKNFHTLLYRVVLFSFFTLVIWLYTLRPTDFGEIFFRVREKRKKYTQSITYIQYSKLPPCKVCPHVFESVVRILDASLVFRENSTVYMSSVSSVVFTYFRLLPSGGPSILSFLSHF